MFFGYSRLIFLFSFLLLIFLTIETALGLEIGVTFNPNPDEKVVGYKLYYGLSENLNNSIDLGTKVEYYSSDFQEGKTYYFALTSYDEDGNESRFSEIVSLKVPFSGDSQANSEVFNETDVNPDFSDTNINYSETDDFEPAIGDDNITNLTDWDDTSHILEVGEVFIDHNWTKVSFNKTFLNPVVIAKPASSNDMEPGIIRIRNINQEGFEIKIQEWDYMDGIHDCENVSYLVIEKGTYLLPGDVMLEAGIIEADGAGFQFKAFTNSFNQVPVVVSSVISANENDAVSGRIMNIGLDGFDICLQEQELTKEQHNIESISYIAWEPSSGSLNGVTFEVETTGNLINHNFYYIPITEIFDVSPFIFADMQTVNEIDTANLRRQNLNLHGFEIKVSEEQSKDSENVHCTENIGYILLHIDWY